jgi:hypothetical protein
MFSKPPRMCSKSRWDAGERPHGVRRPSSTRIRGRRYGLAAVSATLTIALAALPTASALASADSSRPDGTGTAMRPALSVGQLVTPGQLLSAGELQTLLSTLPLSDLSGAQLAHYLATLEGVSALSGLKLGLLSSKKLGVVGLEESLRKAIEQLGPSATLGELVKIEDFLPELTDALEGKLGDLGLLGPLLEKLPGGGSAGLEGALGSLNLEQLVGSLLKDTTPREQLAEELAGLAGGLFGELGAEHKLEGLLGGSELTGGFGPESVKEVAEDLNTTPAMVGEDLGQTASELPESTTMLTAPLKDGKLAGVAPAVKGLVTGVLDNVGETPIGEEGGGKVGSGEGGNEGSGEGGGEGSGEGKGSEEGKGSGEGNGSGNGEGGKGSGSGSGSGEGKGGSGEGKAGGGQGGTGSGGSTTVLLTTPASSPAAPAPKQRTGTVAILSHRVRGHVATIVLSVPAAGTATLAGKGVRGASRQAARAEHLTLRASLSRAASASLRRHHRLPVRLNASFHPTNGSSSSVTVTAIFR